MENKDTITFTRAHYIVDGKPQNAGKAVFAGSAMLVMDPEGRPLDRGVVNLSDMYTILYCDQIRNLAFIQKKTGTVSMVILSDDGEYDRLKAGAEKHAGAVALSRQNYKIAQYARKISDKVKDGVDITVMDAVDESKALYCPECGVQVEPGQQYCFECGAELPRKEA